VGKRDKSYLVGGLVGVIEGLSVGAPEQQQSAAAILTINGAHMQRGVAGGVSRIHVSSVEEQVLQVLHQTMTTRLHKAGRNIKLLVLFAGKRVCGRIWVETLNSLKCE